MDNSKKDFIYLLSCFLNGKEIEDRSYDWESIYHLSKINDVAPIMAYLFKAISPENRPVGELLQYYRKQFATSVSQHQLKLMSAETVDEILNKNGIDHMFTKGAVISDLYPVPELRTSGDIDAIVKAEDFSKAIKALDENEAVTKRALVTNTFTFTVCDYIAELHDNADVASSYFDDVFSKARLEKNSRYGLDEYDTLLYVLCHLVKHLSYRGAGIRMLMDLDVIIRSIDNFDIDHFISLCSEAGVEKSARVLLSLCSYWFNTPVNSFYAFDEESQLLEKLATVLIDGGSFGYETNSVPVNYINKNADGKKLSFFAKIKIILSMAFPSSEYLAKCYPYFAKHNCLYLVAVFNRLFDSLFKKKAQAKKSITQILSSSDETAALRELLDELEIKI